CKSPTVFRTVRSLGSCLRTFSYSAMAFCSLPCWTYFSAELRTFALLKPRPNAILVRTPDDPPFVTPWQGPGRVSRLTVVSVPRAEPASKVDLRECQL